MVFPLVLYEFYTRLFYFTNKKNIFYFKIKMNEVEK